YLLRPARRRSPCSAGDDNVQLQAWRRRPVIWDKHHRRRRPALRTGKTRGAEPLQREHPRDLRCRRDQRWRRPGWQHNPHDHDVDPHAPRHLDVHHLQLPDVDQLHLRPDLVHLDVHDVDADHLDLVVHDLDLHRVLHDGDHHLDLDNLHLLDLDNLHLDGLDIVHDLGLDLVLHDAHHLHNLDALDYLHLHDLVAPPDDHDLVHHGPH